VNDLNIVRKELELFQPALAAKPQLVAANKMDAVDDMSRVVALERRAGELGFSFFRISGATGEGLSALLEAMWRGLSAEVQDPAGGRHPDSPNHASNAPTVMSTAKVTSRELPTSNEK